MAVYKHHAKHKVEHLDRVLQAIRKVGQLVTLQNDRDTLLQETCQCLIETRGYRSAWIIGVDETGEIVAVAQAGLKESIDSLMEQLKQGLRPSCWSQIMGMPEVLSVEDPLSGCGSCFLQEAEPGWGELAIRLEHNQETYGMISVTIPASLATDEEERALFKEVASDIAFALHNLSEKEKHRQIVEALGESENRYKQLLELVTDYIYSVKIEQGQPVTMAHGPGCEAVMGYTPQEYETDSHLWFRMIHPEDRDAVTAQTTRLLAGETVLPLEHRIIHKNGSIRWVRNTAVPRYNNQGELVACDGLIADITVRKKAEEEAQKHREQLQSILRAAPIGIGMVIDRTFIFVNQKLLEMLGYSRQELVGQNSRMIYPSQEEYERVGRMKYGQIKEKGLGTVETQVQCKDGRIMDVLLSSCPIDPSDLSQGVIFTAMDITRRKQSQEDIRRARDQAQQYLDVAEVMLVALNAQGEITLLNRKGHRILGYQEEELIGQNWFDTCLPLSAREAVKGVFGKLMAGEIEPIEYYENPVLTKSGEARIIAWHNAILTDETGKINGTLSSGEDITERKQAETEREELQTQLLQAQKMEAIGRLTGGIAHDFNNLLTAINGFTELAQQRLPPGSPLQEMLGHIMDSGQRAARLVRQLLAFSSRQIIAPRVLNLNTLIIDLDRMLRRIIGEDIRIEMTLAPNLWPIKADPVQMEQIIVNLAVNARDAMPDGGKLAIKTENIVLGPDDLADQRETPPGKYILLTVNDTGGGMSEEVKAHIFEPFFTTKQPGRGTGLGLATVYGIVKQNEGDIKVHSKEGQGTTVKIFLPRTEETDQPPVTLKDFEAMPSGSETILLVEDDAAVRRLTRQVLERQGYRILETGSGQEALGLVANYSEPIHLLITDVVMPEMDGLSLAQQLTQTHPHLKTIFISGYTDKPFSEPDMVGSEIRLLQKPFSATALALEVRSTLDEPADESSWINQIHCS